LSGTSGQSKPLEAIKIRLTEPISEAYDVYYRVHAQNFGWLGWTENGNPAGTTGYSYRLEAIEIRLVEKGAEAPGKTIRAFVEYSPSTPSPSDRPVYVNGFLDPRSVTPTMVSDASPLTVLVNKFYCVSKDYVPSLVPAKSSKQCYLRPEAADAWNLMRAACYDATGKTLYLSSGYRSYATQKFIFENAIANKGLERAISKYAYPGRSEHQLGLALDITTTDYKSISGSFLKTAAGQWMVEHAHEYGFILRYPSGKESITGYAFEAWHFRYVGVDPAIAMHNSRQTFEEYLGKA